MTNSFGRCCTRRIDTKTVRVHQKHKEADWHSLFSEFVGDWVSNDLWVTVGRISEKARDFATGFSASSVQRGTRERVLFRIPPHLGVSGCTDVIVPPPASCPMLRTLWRCAEIHALSLPLSFAKSPSIGRGLFILAMMFQEPILMCGCRSAPPLHETRLACRLRCTGNSVARSAIDMHAGAPSATYHRLMQHQCRGYEFNAKPGTEDVHYDTRYRGARAYTNEFPSVVRRARLGSLHRKRIAPPKPAVHRSRNGSTCRSRITAASACIHACNLLSIFYPIDQYRRARMRRRFASPGARTKQMLQMCIIFDRCVCIVRTRCVDRDRQRAAAAAAAVRRYGGIQAGAACLRVRNAHHPEANCQTNAVTSTQGTGL
jgi:hypothetical protein